MKQADSKVNAQHIRLPNITKLQFQGETEKSKKLKAASMLGLEINQLIVRKKTPVATMPTEQQQQSLKYLYQPNEGLINIRTIKVIRDHQTDDENEREKKVMQSEDKQKRASSNVRVSRPIRLMDPDRQKPDTGSRQSSVKIRSKVDLAADDFAALAGTLVAASFGLINEQSLESFKAFVDKGNNSVLVKQTLKNRPWWNIIPEEDESATLSWTQFRQKNLTTRAETRVPTDKKITISKKHVAAFEQCQSFLKLLIPQYDGKISITDIVKFLNRCNQETRFNYDPRKMQLTNHIPQNGMITNKKALFKNLSKYYTSIDKNPFEFIPVTYHVNGTDDEQFQAFTEYASTLPKKKNLWIIKPGENTNRGNGITVHKSAAEVKSHLDGISSKHTYIIQSYIRPYLYCQRKFDIRCYALLVLINKRIKGYWFEEGYIRTASEPFSYKKTDKMIHLTNDAVQKHGQNYGKYEPGNKLSYQEMAKYVQINSNKDFHADAVPLMRNVCRDIFLSTEGKLGGDRSEDAFEVYGLDFMLDEDLKPWLIEVNTNPCLELSSSLLSRVIPEMLDNAFKISLDPFLSTSKKAGNLTSLIKSNRFELIFQS